ncbi:MAG: hypothetical protein V3S68_03410 [Dehalococcoidia bacterium]
MTMTEKIALIINELTEDGKYKTIVSTELMARVAEVEINEKFNGWPNYATWCVNLWLTNDVKAYEILEALAPLQGAVDININARALRAYVEEHPRMAGASMYVDLLKNALDDVDWVRILEANRDEQEYPTLLQSLKDLMTDIGEPDQSNPASIAIWELCGIAINHAENPVHMRS